MISVRIPIPLQRHTGGLARVELPCQDVAECLARLRERFPGLRDELAGPTADALVLYVNGRDIRLLSGERTSLREGDEVTVLLPIAGGAQGRRLRGMARDLVAALDGRVLVLDGAMGTMLMDSGVKARCPEEINLISPETVRAVHAAYVEAGADVIETNSFGGSRPKMALAGRGDIVLEANLAAARIAREVAGDSVLVAGSIGPTGEFLEPIGHLTYDQAVDIFWEQAAALAEGGVDFFVVETMYDLNEARAAVEAAARTGKLVACTMTFESHGRTMMGVSPAAALEELRAAGAVVVGANCGVGPDDMVRTVEAMHHEDGSAWLMAQPNAGLPRMKDGQTVYSVSPEEMVKYVSSFLKSGVRLVGSCCGSSPDFTRAIAEAVKGA